MVYVISGSVVLRLKESLRSWMVFLSLGFVPLSMSPMVLAQVLLNSFLRHLAQDHQSRRHICHVTLENFTGRLFFLEMPLKGHNHQPFESDSRAFLVHGLVKFSKILARVI